MKDSLGGSFLLNLVLLFTGIVISLFVGILSYSKAYQVKNRIIEMIEKYGVYEHTNDSIVNDAVDELNPDLKNYGYDASNPNKCGDIRSKLVSGDTAKYKDEKLSTNKNKNYGYNYCVFEVCDKKDKDTGVCVDEDGKYYVVVTFVKFEFPVIGDLLTFPVYGETQILGKSYDY